MNKQQIEQMVKPVHAKPSLYAFYFLQLKEVALKYGYNLVLHGSMNRDLDLIAIPWQEVIGSHDEMIEEFITVLGGDLLYADGVMRQLKPDHKGPKYKITHHGRMQYVINVNRESSMKNGVWTDPQYYIDISVLQADAGKESEGEAAEPKIFKCKCGYETSNSTAWCTHADSCNA